MKWPKISVLNETYYCKYSVLENKLVVLTENQEILLQALELIYKKLEALEKRL